MADNWKLFVAELYQTLPFGLLERHHPVPDFMSLPKTYL
jgi:hypothetical protein